MSVITRTIIDKEKGMSYTFELDQLQVNVSGSGRKITTRDPDTDKSKSFPPDNINPSINIFGAINTDEAIAKLVQENPAVQEFIDLLLDKATEAYVFPDVASRKASAQ